MAIRTGARECHLLKNMAVGQNQWWHFGVGAPPILVYVSGDWDVLWGYGLWTHGYMWLLSPVGFKDNLSLLEICVFLLGDSRKGSQTSDRFGRMTTFSCITRANQ